MKNDLDFIRGYLKQIKAMTVVHVSRGKKWHNPFLLRLRAQNNKHKSNDWRFMLLMSFWRLEDNSKMLGGTLDDIDVINKAIQQLVGKRISEVELKDYTFSLKFIFEENLYLYTIPGLSQKTLFWSIISPIEKLTVGSEGAWWLNAFSKD